MLRGSKTPPTCQVAFVTGAASGIGRATAVLLADKGADVHLVDVDEAGLAETQALVEAYGVRAPTHVVDVSDAAAVEALAATVFEQETAVDLLHLNAGIGVGGRFVDLTRDDIERTVNVNLLGVLYGLHSFVPLMRDQGRHGHVVSTASGAGLVPIPRLGTYSATKHGVVAITEVLHAEHARDDLSFSVICPGVIDTPILRNSPQRGGMVDVDKLYARAKRLAASPTTVAEAVWGTYVDHQVVVVVAPIFVTPAWAIRRISTRAGHVSIRLASATFDRALGRG